MSCSLLIVDRSLRGVPLIHCVCPQTASSGHGAEGEAVEASPEPAGDLQPPPRERPELPRGGATLRYFIRQEECCGFYFVFLFVCGLVSIFIPHIFSSVCCMEDRTIPACTALQLHCCHLNTHCYLVVGFSFFWDIFNY